MTAKARIEKRIEELLNPGDIGVTGRTINRLLVQELEQVARWLEADNRAKERPYV